MKTENRLGSLFCLTLAILKQLTQFYKEEFDANSIIKMIRREKRSAELLFTEMQHLLGKVLFMKQCRCLNLKIMRLEERFISS